MSEPVATHFDERWQPLLASAGLGDYDAVMASRTGQALVKPGLGRRERIRVTLTGTDGRQHTVYLKRYPRSVTARDEWRALQAVRAAEVPTMHPIAFGTGPAGGFVIVSAVPGDALERCQHRLFAREDLDTLPLGEALGVLVGRLHRAGLVHQDLYASHLFVDERQGRFLVHLIDLARVKRPRWRRWRWRAKDLAQLRFSLAEPWASAHWPGILAAYEHTLGRRVPGRVYRAIDRRIAWMRRREARRAGGTA